MAEEKEPFNLKAQVIDKMAALITAAFGLVAALAWNSAIQAIFLKVFGSQTEIVPMLVYAVSVTVIAVALTIWIAYVANKLK